MSSPYLASILLACGCSKRFGSNKLLAPFRGQPLCERVFQRHPMELFQQNLVVTRYPQAAIFASQQGFSVVEVFDGAEDVAQTIGYLADAPFVTGQVVGVSGGFII